MTDLEKLQEAHAALESQWREQRAEIERLRAAIRQALKENAYLADGDHCTLHRLKKALGREEEI
jgi:hypothetical protein